MLHSGVSQPCNSRNILHRLPEKPFSEQFLSVFQWNFVRCKVSIHVYQRFFMEPLMPIKNLYFQKAVAFNGNFTIPWGHRRGFMNGIPTGIPAGRSHDNDNMMNVVCLDYIHTIKNFFIGRKAITYSKEAPTKESMQFPTQILLL